MLPVYGFFDLSRVISDHVFMYMSPGEEQHTPDSTISEDTTPDLSVGEQHET